MVLLFVSANFPSLLFKECATQKAANHVAHTLLTFYTNAVMMESEMKK